jgi:HK97 gp10 family phage protein
MARREVTLEGFAPLHRAFSELPKATGKAALRRAGMKALEPMRRVADAKAPRLTGATAKSVKISTKKKGRTQGGKKYDGPQAQEISMGPTGIGRLRGQLQEFGTYKEKPQPFMRPAWDAEADNTLESLKAALWDQLERAAARLAKKAAKAGKGG